MPVITRDITVEDLRRDTVFQWLGQPENLFSVLQAGFPEARERGPDRWELSLPLPWRVLGFGCVLEARDDSRGGRRIVLRTEGRRTRGTVRFSLTTTRPATHTLVTLHADYDPGAVAGRLVDWMVLRNRLEAAWSRVLEAVPDRVEA